MTLARTALFLLTNLALALPLAAQELVNGSFDTDIDGWGAPPCVPEEPNLCRRSWTDLDRWGSEGSGSARLYKDYVSGSLLPLDQCLQVGPELELTMVGWFQPTLENPPFSAGLQFTYLPDAFCSDFANYLGFVRSELATPTGTWIEVKLFATTPPLTQSVEVRAFIYETTAAVPVTAHVDDIKVGIFFASFEDGLLDDWSDTKP